MHHYPYTELVTGLSLLVYFWTIGVAGKARGTHKVMAPSTDGPPEYRRAYRAQMNTLEQLAFFLPALWLFAVGWGDMYAAMIGVFWPIGRIIYVRSYLANPEKRAPGMIIGFFAALILLLGGIAGTITSML